MSRKCRGRVTDVVTWHDIDLDYVLGDYTESENELIVAASAVNFPVSGSSSDGEDPGKENKPTSGKPGDVGGVIYKCPVCEKALKSISGFRGHVMKQHRRADLKGNSWFLYSVLHKLSRFYCCKTAVSPVRQQCRYCSLGLNHRYHPDYSRLTLAVIITCWKKYGQCIVNVGISCANSCAYAL